MLKSRQQRFYLTCSSYSSIGDGFYIILKFSQLSLFFFNGMVSIYFLIFFLINKNYMIFL
jgi:hypothetical protein